MPGTVAMELERNTTFMQLAPDVVLMELAPDIALMERDRHRPHGVGARCRLTF